jgi:hypothetical protein
MMKPIRMTIDSPIQRMNAVENGAHHGNSIRDVVFGEEEDFIGYG